MALSKIWVFAEATDGKVATITLEMLAKARELADTVEAVIGGDGAAVAARARRPRRHQGATPPATSAARSPASPVAVGHRRRGRGRQRAPTPSSSAPPTTAATSPAACR